MSQRRVTDGETGGESQEAPLEFNHIQMTEKLRATLSGAREQLQAGFETLSANIHLIPGAQQRREFAAYVVEDHLGRARFLQQQVNALEPHEYAIPTKSQRSRDESDRQDHVGDAISLLLQSVLETGPSAPGDRAELLEHWLQRLEASVSQLRGARNAAVRQALELEHMPTAVVAKRLGVSKTAVLKMRDGEPSAKSTETTGIHGIGAAHVEDRDQ